MCGIVGGLLARGVDEAALERSLDSLHHRGPDSRGRWISPDRRWFLGHTRLSIIGLENGQQPMSDARGDVQLVANGEFYGYREIREKLRSAGFRFSTDSDSEIALHLYRQQGMSLCQRLRGEYAVLIADPANRSLFAIRDRFGIKPLFYAIHEGSVFFASEVKALLELGVPARWNREAVLQEAYLVRPHAHALFEGIYSVPAGHYAVAQEGQVSVYPYWDLDFPSAEQLAADDRSDAEIVSGFREVLSDAVRERLVADVEVASYLSGGIDSCAVLGLAQGMMDRPIRAFTLCFDDALFDESQLAEEQASLCGATYHPVPVSSRDLADAYSDAVWHAETPFVNGHGVAKYLLSRAVRDAGIKVVFTGEGADEMLGGYAPFRRDVLLYNSESQDPATVSRLLAEMRERTKRFPPSSERRRSRRMSSTSCGANSASCLPGSRSSPRWGRRRNRCFAREMNQAVEGMNPYASIMARLPVDARMKGRDPLNQGLYSWSRIHLPNFILTFLSDRMEMAHSIEGRVPFWIRKSPSTVRASPCE